MQRQITCGRAFPPRIPRSFSSSKAARFFAENAAWSAWSASLSTVARSPYSHPPSEGQKQKLRASRTRRYWAVRSPPSQKWSSLSHWILSAPFAEAEISLEGGVCYEGGMELVMCKQPGGVGRRGCAGQAPCETGDGRIVDGYLGGDGGDPLW